MADGNGTNNPATHAMLKPLLIVLVLTAVATTIAILLPSGNELVAILLDLVPIVGVLGATVFVIFRLRRKPFPKVRLLTAGYSYLAGGLVAALGLAHLVAVVLRAVNQARKEQFVYDFRFYSLLLLGVFLIAAGISASNKAANLAHGERGAWKASLTVWIIILAINLPLVPLQSFAVFFSALAVLELLLLVSLRKQFN